MTVFKYENWFQVSLLSYLGRLKAVHSKMQIVIVNMHMRKLARVLGGPESEHLGLGYNPAHNQGPCWGANGRGLDWVRAA